ncbi:MAG: methyltransferase domain-containing protein [bacterium]|nr:methyltransferase domain-containing protein [bacterium]
MDRTALSANRRYFMLAYQSGVHGWPVDIPDPRLTACLERLIGEYPGGRLLDMGCGEGRHALAAAAMGFRVTAVDYEPLALRRARGFAQDHRVSGIVFRRASVLQLPFARASFDIALDAGCLHHQLKRDWPAYRSILLKVLAPGGAYLLSVFSPRFRFFRETNRPWHIAHGAYRRCFTADDIRKLFDADFQFIALTEKGGRDGGFWYALMKRRPRAGNSGSCLKAS